MFIPPRPHCSANLSFSLAHLHLVSLPNMCGSTISEVRHAYSESPPRNDINQMVFFRKILQ